MGGATDDRGRDSHRVGGARAWPPNRTTIRVVVVTVADHVHEWIDTGFANVWECDIRDCDALRVDNTIYTREQVEKMRSAVEDRKADY